jgi:transposase
VPRTQSGQSRRQEQAIAELLQGASIAAAAEKCGISSRTLKRWLASEAFQQEYRAAKRRLVDAATNRLLRTMDEAAATLETVMKSKKASMGLKVSAATRLLDRARWAHEDEDLAARIAALEAEQKGSE